MAKHSGKHDSALVCVARCMLIRYEETPGVYHQQTGEFSSQIARTSRAARSRYHQHNMSVSVATGGAGAILASMY